MFVIGLIEGTVDIFEWFHLLYFPHRSFSLKCWCWWSGILKLNLVIETVKLSISLQMNIFQNYPSENSLLHLRCWDLNHRPCYDIGVAPSCPGPLSLSSRDPPGRTLSPTGGSWYPRWPDTARLESPWSGARGPSPRTCCRPSQSGVSSPLPGPAEPNQSAWRALVESQKWECWSWRGEGWRCCGRPTSEPGTTWRHIANYWQGRTEIKKT